MDIHTRKKEFYTYRCKSGAINSVSLKYHDLMICLIVILCFSLLSFLPIFHRQLIMKIVFPLLVLALNVAANKHYEDLAAKQIIKYAERTTCPSTLTVVNGCPVEDRDAKVSLNRRLLFNEYLVETLTHLNRQRIPERVVHAKGAGAFGYFEVTHDITDICKAKFLNQINKRTSVAVRFSLISSDIGSMDMLRGGRGFAIKFYTEEGNFDLVGLNIPVFPVKDPLFFPTLANSLGRNPATNLLDINMMWDFTTLRPESIHSFLYVFGDLGIPDGYRYMPGHSIHTLQVSNQTGHISFVRFLLTSDQGYKYLTSAEAESIGGRNPDYFVKDLYNAIANGDYPSWTLSVQSLTLEDAKQAGFDVFDVTKVLPLDKYPPRPVGRLVLNKNPGNYFAEFEQIAMCPGNLVPGIQGAPDKMFEARRLSYRDAHYYRLKTNFQNIPVNCPYRSSTYNVAGNFDTTSSGAPIYHPNSYKGPEAYVDESRTEVIDWVQDDSPNFDQASKYYENLTEDRKKRLVKNIVANLGLAEAKLQERALKWFRVINEQFGQRVADGLQLDKSKNQTDNPYPDHFVKINL